MSHQGVKHERHHSGRAILQCARQARARTTIPGMGKRVSCMEYSMGMMHGGKNDARLPYNGPMGKNAMGGCNGQGHGQGAMGKVPCARCHVQGGQTSAQHCSAPP